MQDLLTVRREIDALAAAHAPARLSVVLARDRWNPVAAVVLERLPAPAGVAPARFDLRVPLPNLYGFTASATVALTAATLLAAPAGCAPAVVPGLQHVDARVVANYQSRFVDFRERSGWEPVMNIVFLTPHWSPAGFEHTPLADFVRTFLDFLSDPRAYYLRDVRTCEERWAVSRDAWWLFRVALLWAELGDFAKARDVCAEGQRLFPARTDFPGLVRSLAGWDNTPAAVPLS